MIQHLAVSDRPVPCCELRILAIAGFTCDSRLEPVDFPHHHLLLEPDLLRGSPALSIQRPNDLPGGLATARLLLRRLRPKAAYITTVLFQVTVAVLQDRF